MMENKLLLVMSCASYVRKGQFVFINDVIAGLCTMMFHMMFRMMFHMMFHMPWHEHVKICPLCPSPRARAAPQLSACGWTSYRRAEDLRESHDWTPTKGKYTIVKTEEQERLCMVAL